MLLKEDRLKDAEMLEILKMIAPGTSLREGIDNILRARTGALIVIGDPENIMDVIDGGFYLNKEYSPAHLYELAKMDGAIVISRDLKKFLYANALLIPDYKIPTVETGTRHKAAERTAKQTNELVICISQRRNIITLYKGNKKYITREPEAILTSANQALQTLEKYKIVLDDTLNNLSFLEFDDSVMLGDVAFVIQRAEMVMRIAAEIERYICELGNEGRLISMQLTELISNIEEEELHVIEDYKYSEELTALDIHRLIRQLSYEELMDLSAISKLIGYSCSNNCYDIVVSPRGFRLLSKVPRVPATIVRNIVEKFTGFKGVIKASIEELDEVVGVGTTRARMIKDGLKRIQELILFDLRKT